MLTTISLGFNIWGSILMRQEFNPLWFIPQSTYLSQFFSTLERDFPDNGQMATLYIQTNNLHDHLRDMDELILKLKNETDIVSRVEDWFVGFQEFSSKRHYVGEFTLRLYLFLIFTISLRIFVANICRLA